MFSPSQKQYSNSYKHIIFKHIWQFPQKEPTARKTLYLPKTQGRVGLIQSQYHSMAMPIKHFLKLKIETNQETWVMITRYKLTSTLYQLHKDFQYIISKKFIKTTKNSLLL